MSSVNAALGKGKTIEHKGKAYSFAPIDHVQVIGDFQDHLRSRALAEVDSIRRLMGPVAGQMGMTGYLDNAALGVYDFGSPYWLSSIQYPANQKALILYCLRVNDKTVVKLLAEEIYNDHYDEIQKILYGDAAGDPSTAHPDSEDDSKNV